MKKLILTAMVVLAFSSVAFAKIELGLSNMALAKTEDVTKRITTKSDGSIIISEETKIHKDNITLSTRKESIKLPNGKIFKFVMESEVLDNGNRAEGKAVTKYENDKIESSTWREETFYKK